LLLLVAVVNGQCYSQPANNCTTSGLNCSLSSGFCSRFIAPQCNTSSATTCPGQFCGNASYFTNTQSCSKCADTCPQFVTNASCSGSSFCVWTGPSCYATPGPPAIPPCVTAQSQATCVAQDNCFWLAFTSTQCGVQNPPRAYCAPCNGTGGVPGVARSALVNNIASTCSWNAVAPFVDGYSVTINAAAQSATSCSALTAPNPAFDQTVINGGANQGLFLVSAAFSNSATITCVAPTAAPSSAPTTAAPSAAPTTGAPQAASPTAAPQAGQKNGTSPTPTAPTSVNPANALFPSLALMLVVFFVSY